MKYFHLLIVITISSLFATNLSANNADIFKQKDIEICWELSTAYDLGLVQMKLLNMGGDNFLLNGIFKSDPYNETHLMTGSARFIDDNLHIIAVASKFAQPYAETTTLYILADKTLNGQVKTITVRAGLDWYSLPEYDAGELAPISCDDLE